MGFSKATTFLFFLFFNNLKKNKINLSPSKCSTIWCPMSINGTNNFQFLFSSVIVACSGVMSITSWWPESKVFSFRHFSDFKVFPSRYLKVLSQATKMFLLPYSCSTCMIPSGTLKWISVYDCLTNSLGWCNFFCCIVGNFFHGHLVVRGSIVTHFAGRAYLSVQKPVRI